MAHGGVRRAADWSHHADGLPDESLINASLSIKYQNLGVKGKLSEWNNEGHVILFLLYSMMRDGTMLSF